MKKTVVITLDTELITNIDKKRGLIPRSTFINAILTESFGRDKILAP